MKMWIARDECGLLSLHNTKPKKFYEECIGYTWIGRSMALPMSLYPEVTFENSPKEVELKLIEKLKDIPPAPAVIGNPILNN